jgi:prepilin-type processing-associated H-X9-DG protein
MDPARRAVTLVELLVVTAIGFVLAAILKQSLTTTCRGTARQEACQSNLKQLGTALALYAQDHDERLPPTPVWMDATTPYLAQNGVFLCPSRPGTVPAYAYNRLMHERLLKEIAAPSRAMIGGESTLGVRNASDFLEHFAAPHHERGGILFADGHVKTLTAAPAAETGVRPDPARLGR